MSWLRLYTDILTDAKVLTLNCGHFKTWVLCLCIAKNSNGYLPSVRDLGFMLRLRPDIAQQHIEALTKAGLLDQTDNGLQPHNWNGRQYVSDDSSRRVRDYRGKVRATGCVVGAYTKHKEEVFARDDEACVYCGSTEKLCLDHMVPVSMGGDDDPSNLAVACKSCNSGKAGRTPELAGYRFIGKSAEEAYKSTVTRLNLSPPVTVTVTASDTDSDTEYRTEQNRRKPPNPPCAIETPPSPIRLSEVPPLPTDDTGFPIYPKMTFPWSPEQQVRALAQIGWSGVKNITDAQEDWIVRLNCNALTSLPDDPKSLYSIHRRLVCFASFWTLYPKIKDKRDARCAFLKQCQTPDEAEDVVEFLGNGGAEAIIAEQPNPKYRKHPATWLNARLWEEKPKEPAPVEPSLFTNEHHA